MIRHPFRNIVIATFALLTLLYVGGCEEHNIPDTPNQEQPEQPEQPETPEQPEQPEQPETPEQPEKPETPEQPEGSESGSALPPFDKIEKGIVFSTRVMTYNVHNCKGTDGVVDYKRIGEAIAVFDLDAVALQELDSMTTRYPGQDVVKNIADHAGLYPTFGAAIDRQGGKYGVGVLTKEKPISHFTIPLPCSSEPRVVLVVELSNYYFCSTHFSLLAEYRNKAVEIIVEEVKKLSDKPIILAGDLNALRSEESLQNLAKHFDILEKIGKSYTFPSSQASKEIDFICLYKSDGAAAVLKEHYVPFIPILSDHLPVIADMTVCR